MKRKFALGDRVRVYGYLGVSSGLDGMVTQVREDGAVYVNFKHESDWAHPKQCHHLKPRRPLVETYAVIDGKNAVYPRDTRAAAEGTAKLWDKETPTCGPHRVVLMREVRRPKGGGK